MMFGAGWELRHMSISELMHRPERARRMEVFTGAGRRRTWPADEKAAIVAESYAPGRTVCGVARRHGLTPAQLFTWRRLARRARQPLKGMHPASAVLLGLGWGEIDTGLCWRDLYRAYVWTEGLLAHGGGQHAPILGRLGEARHC